MARRPPSADLAKDAPEDWTDLHYAVWNHDFDGVRSLVRKGGINSRDSYGWTPLHLACTSGESHLFDSHQISARGLTRFSYLGSGKSKYNRNAWGPTRKHPSFNNSERTQSMGVLEILLDNGADPNIVAKSFCTPLHCAANSGWTSHATALINAGAEVYTGPECSPLCWAKDGSGSNHPVARLLREKLGPEGMKLIEEDHQREASAFSRGGSFPHAQPRAALPAVRVSDVEIPTPYRTARSRTATSKVPFLHRGHTGRSRAVRPVNSDGLCLTCANMALDDLVNKPGYIHLSSLELVRESAISCSFCKVIYALLNEGRETGKGDVTQVIVHAIADKVEYYQTGQTLRSLELKLSAGCFCDKSYGANDRSLDFKDCHGDCGILAQAQVGIFTLENKTDYPHKVLQGNHLNSNPLSEHALSIARNWLHKCTKEHRDCSFIKSSSDLDESPLPTRVIDVKCLEDIEMIKISIGSGLSGQFAALSHRWVSGEMPQWVTTQKTVHQRMAGFPLRDLPQSLIDAVDVTRKLGLRYLWVDSICIIQDSAHDWNNESSRMVDIYAGAFVTLFADCGSDDDTGFLNARRSLGLPPILLRLQSGDLPPMPVYVRYADVSIPMRHQPAKGHLFKTDVDKSFLSDRAWILQERVISRRILHFGKNQMFWECRSTALAEDGHLFQQEWGRKWLIESHQVILGTSLTNPEIHLRWAKLVEKYTARKLTKGKDKLPALSGIANVFGTRTRDKYLAGLWMNSFHLNLLWHSNIKDPDQLLSRPPEYRAPSWSWASVDCAVYMRGDREPKDFELEPAFDTIDAHADTVSKDSFGQVLGGSATLSGRLKGAINIGPYKEKIGDTDKGYNPVYNLEMAPIGTMRHDARDDLQTENIMCFKLYDNEPWSNEHFLVLVPVQSGGDNPSFRRIGLGNTLLWGRSQYEKISFFEGCEKETITLV